MPRSAGFTLIELVVAIAITGVVVALGHRLVTGVVDAVATLDQRRDAVDRAANARRLLTTLVGSIDLRPGGEDAFRGEPARLACPTWLDDAHGWPARRALVLEVVDETLVATLDGVAVPLQSGVRALGIDYLLAWGGDERWVRSWMSEASVPQALRLRLAYAETADTLLLLIGGRG